METIQKSCGGRSKNKTNHSIRHRSNKNRKSPCVAGDRNTMNKGHKCSGANVHFVHCTSIAEPKVILISKYARAITKKNREKYCIEYISNAHVTRFPFSCVMLSDTVASCIKLWNGQYFIVYGSSETDERVRGWRGNEYAGYPEFVLMFHSIQAQITTTTTTTRKPNRCGNTFLCFIHSHLSPIAEMILFL